MVRVKMGQHHFSYISGRNTQRLKLGTNFFVGMYGESARPAIERMPCRMIPAFVNPRCLARVDQDEALLVLDEPGVDRKPLRPLLVEKHIGHAEQALVSCLPLWPPDLHKSSANGMNFQHS